MSVELRGTATAADGGLTPGEHLRAEIERLGLDQVAVSQATGVSRQSINNIVNGRQPISRAMAGKLGRLTGQSSDYWLHASFPLSGEGAASPSAEVRPLGVGVLVNHQITRAIEDNIIIIEPFNEDNVQRASIDLTLDDFVTPVEGGHIDISDGQTYTLKAGTAVSVKTKELVGFPMDYIGRVGAMSKLAMRGIMTSHGFQIDPGFEGFLQFCIFNAGTKDYTLRAGDPIISLEIMPLAALPTQAKRDDDHLRESADRNKVVSFFRPDACDQKIRAAIEKRVKATAKASQVEARLPELAIELTAATEEVARAETVKSALAGLKALRAHPESVSEQHDRYARFFDELAGQIALNAAEAQRAVDSLGFRQGGDGARVVALRNGKSGMLNLPTGASSVSLRQLARQLDEEPAELMLIFTGLKSYR